MSVAHGSLARLFAQPAKEELDLNYWGCWNLGQIRRKGGGGGIVRISQLFPSWKNSKPLCAVTIGVCVCYDSLVTI